MYRVAHWFFPSARGAPTLDAVPDAA